MTTLALADEYYVLGGGYFNWSTIPRTHLLLLDLSRSSSRRALWALADYTRSLTQSCASGLRLAGSSERRCRKNRSLRHRRNLIPSHWGSNSITIIGLILSYIQHTIVSRRLSSEDRGGVRSACQLIGEKELLRHVFLM